MFSAKIIYILMTPIEDWGNLTVSAMDVPRVGEYVVLENKNGYIQPFIVKIVAYKYKRFLFRNRLTHIKIYIQEKPIS